MKQSKILKWKQYDYYGILTISNPPKNVITEPDFVELDILKQWMSNEKLKGIIITGEGHHFSAGADLERLDYLKKNHEELTKRLNTAIDILKFLQNLDIPVISAIQGVCLGAGLEIALHSHIRVCSNRSIFAFPETDLDLVPGLGGIYNFMQIANIQKTLQWILSADFFTASEALEIGLVDHMVASKDVMNFSLSLLEKMVKNRKKKVIKFVMRAIRNRNSLTKEEAIKEETKMFVELARDKIDTN